MDSQGNVLPVHFFGDTPSGISNCIAILDHFQEVARGIIGKEPLIPVGPPFSDMRRVAWEAGHMNVVLESKQVDVGEGRHVVLCGR